MKKSSLARFTPCKKEWGWFLCFPPIRLSMPARFADRFRDDGCCPTCKLWKCYTSPFCLPDVGDASHLQHFHISPQARYLCWSLLWSLVQSPAFWSLKFKCAEVCARVRSGCSICERGRHSLW
jgi:hypothetical protein